MERQQKEIKSNELKNPQLNKKKSSASLTLQDFIIKNTLGRGGYGNVYLVEKKSDKKIYAMKQIQKRKLQKQHKQYQALIQKQMLTVLKHPAIVKLRYAFQDKKALYFVLQLCQGGQFLQFIKLNINELNQQVKRFYIAEIVNILQYLHKNGVTHRDIKPQNLMLSSTGHLKIIDFGTAEITKSTLVSNSFKQKIQKMKQKAKQQALKEQQLQQQFLEDESPKKKQRRSTFVGSCYYISPELLQQNYCPPEADLWALGCIIYQLYYLQTPFKDNYEFAVYEKIKKCQVEFPKNKLITDNAIDLIKKLLKKNPDERLGSGKTPELTYEKLKQHPYFAGLDIDKVFDMEVPRIAQLKEPQTNTEITQQMQQQKQKTKTQFTREIVKHLNLIQSNTQKKTILIHGVLQKKVFIKYSYYYFIIFEDLSIQRIKAEEPQKRKNLEINFQSNQLPATLIDKQKFQLITKEKKYTLKCPDEADIWVNTINNQFKNLKKGK